MLRLRDDNGDVNYSNSLVATMVVVTRSMNSSSDDGDEGSCVTAFLSTRRVPNRSFLLFRRCASWLGPTRYSMATSCSPRQITTATRTRLCFRHWASSLGQHSCPTSLATHPAATARWSRLLPPTDRGTFTLPVALLPPPSPP